MQPADPLCLSDEAGGVGVCSVLSQGLGKELVGKDANQIPADLIGKMVPVGYEMDFCEPWDLVRFGYQLLGWVVLCLWKGHAFPFQKGRH